MTVNGANPTQIHLKGDDVRIGASDYHVKAYRTTS
jgi:hypothetical protein